MTNEIKKLTDEYEELQHQNDEYEKKMHALYHQAWSTVGGESKW